MRPAVIYTRISLDLRDGAAVERQEHEAQEAAAARGFTVIDVYSDNDMSATSGVERPDYERLLRDAETGRFEAIFVWALDRLYRRMTDLERIVKVLEPAKVAVFAVQDSDLDLSTANGRMIARITAAVANAEVERLSARLKAHVRQQRREGIAPAAHRPFGWERVSPSRFQPHPEEQPVVAELYERFLAGETLSGLAEWLNAEGHQGSRGGQWRQGRVSALLRAPRNGGYVTGPDGVFVDAADGPLVDRDVWWAAQNILKDPARRRSGPPVKTWLSKRMWCDICGQRVVASSNNASRSRRYPTFTCSKGCVSWKRDVVLEHADREMREVLMVVGPALQEQWEREARHAAAVAANPQLAEDLTRIEEDLRGLAVLLGQGSITFAQFETANAGMLARKQQLETETRHTRAPLGGVLGDHDILNAWEQADITERRRVCDQLGVKLWLGRPRTGALRLEWGQPKSLQDF